jgi:toxin FitB
VNFLLDTNVVSETGKLQPNEGVVRWLYEADEDRVFLSAATVGELRYGIERLPQGRRRSQLEEWLDIELSERFRNRVLNIDEDIAHTWGKLVARSESRGRSLGVMDGFLAATAWAKKMTLVTRNEDDFIATGIALLNPWSE